MGAIAIRRQRQVAGSGGAFRNTLTGSLSHDPSGTIPVLIKLALLHQLYTFIQVLISRSVYVSAKVDNSPYQRVKAANLKEFLCHLQKENPSGTAGSLMVSFPV